MDTNHNSMVPQGPAFETPQVWHGVKRQAQAQVLVRNRNGHKYLVRTEKVESDFFYFPTGCVSHRELEKAIKDKIGFSVQVGVSNPVRIQDMDIGGGWYQRDKGNAHFVVSCTVNAEMLRLGEGANLKWMTRGELRSLLIDQRISPELLQCLAIDLMV